MVGHENATDVFASFFCQKQREMELTSRMFHKLVEIIEKNYNDRTPVTDFMILMTKFAICMAIGSFFTAIYYESCFLCRENHVFVPRVGENRPDHVEDDDVYSKKKTN